MLDRTDFASWQQRIRLYCRGKDNGVNILKSIDEEPYHMGTVRETLAESTEGTPQYGESIHDYYVRFAKLINDMRNIKMTMSRLQLNSKFVNNMLPEWGRFAMAIKLNKGLRDSNYDQLYAYLKQHKNHAKEDKTTMERFSQPTVDPLTLLSNVSNLQHYSPSSSASSSTQVPQPLADSSSPVEDLIKNLTNTLALLTQSYRTFLPQTNNQLRTSSNARNQATAQENGVALDAKQLLFLAGGQDNAFDDDVDEQHVQDLALNVDNMFQADDCDAFDSDVDEAPTAQTIFMANLSYADPITDEARPSYDSDILSEVPDHELYHDAACATSRRTCDICSVQLDNIVDSHADYTIDSNMISYDQYVKDNEVPVVHSDALSVPTDAFMMIYNDMCESYDQSVSNPSWNTVVKNSLTAELATYKEHIELPRPHYNELNKVAIGYKNPLCLTRAKQIQPALYNGHEIIKDNHTPAIVHNAEDTIKIAEITRKKINAKMNDPECVTRKVKIAPHDYSKENFLATFTPQKQLTLQQIFWSNDLIKLKFEALKECTKVSRPIKIFTVYPPNILAMLVPKVLPTKSQVKIHIFTLIQLFSEFDKTCKKRITPTGLTKGERGFEQTKECYLKEVIPFFKTLKDNFEGIQKSLTKEIKEMKDVFEELEAKVAQYAVDRKHDAIERKNLLIANDNLIAECLSQEVFSVATNSELNVARFTEMHVANNTVEARCLALEAELANLRDTNNHDNQNELINHFSKLELAYIPLIRKKQVAVANPSDKSDSTTYRHVVTIKSQQTNVPMPPSTGVNSCPNASRSQPKSHVKPNRISLGKGVNKLPVEDQPRTNKSHLRTSNHVDSSSHLKRRTDRPLVFRFRLLKTYDRGSLTAHEFRKNFIGIVRFRNDHFGAIMGYRDYVIGNSVIFRVYYVEGLEHNLFFVEQFCDSDLEVAFRKYSCYVRDTNGVELIKGSRGSNLYTISIEDMMKSSPICLLSKASKNKSWLWHRRLNHLNFGTINDLARKDLVLGLPRLKFK
nr:integrase, catalytic region, zinc finger, CCHC-type, peptidase aspartic, catalytic [Tanacetum cinerariifolium]